ncbi:Type II toxin-antitoxin system RelE/ParE family toxin [Gammaproteobacteria bacterium]
MRCREHDGVANVTRPKHVVIYADKDGREPFTKWLYDLRDVVGRQRILARVSRLQQGNCGDCEPVGEGVRELRMSFGPGYRVYFGEHQHNIVLILCGGDKGSQSGDILNAKAYWKEYLSHDKL